MPALVFSAAQRAHALHGVLPTVPVQKHDIHARRVALWLSNRKIRVFSLLSSSFLCEVSRAVLVCHGISTSRVAVEELVRKVAQSQNGPAAITKALHHFFQTVQPLRTE